MMFKTLKYQSLYKNGKKSEKNRLLITPASLHLISPRLKSLCCFSAKLTFNLHFKFNICIIKMLKRREESNTYLTHVCKHSCSGNSTEKRLNVMSFQPTLWLSLVISATRIFTDVSLVGVALFPSF